MMPPSICACNWSGVRRCSGRGVRKFPKKRPSSRRLPLCSTGQHKEGKEKEKEKEKEKKKGEGKRKGKEEEKEEEKGKGKEKGEGEGKEKGKGRGVWGVWPARW